MREHRPTCSPVQTINIAMVQGTLLSTSSEYPAARLARLIYVSLSVALCLVVISPIFSYALPPVPPVGPGKCVATCDASGNCTPGCDSSSDDGGGCGPGTVRNSVGRCIPAGTVDCGNNRWCPAGSRCFSDGGCAPIGAVYCGGNRYCNSGEQCIPGGGCMPEGA